MSACFPWARVICAVELLTKHVTRRNLLVSSPVGLEIKLRLVWACGSLVLYIVLHILQMAMLKIWKTKNWEMLWCQLSHDWWHHRLLYDNLECHLWWQRWQHEDSCLSVKSQITLKILLAQLLTWSVALIRCWAICHPSFCPPSLRRLNKSPSVFIRSFWYFPCMCTTILAKNFWDENFDFLL